MSGWEQFGRRGSGLGHTYVAGEISNMQHIKLWSFSLMEPNLFKV